MKRVFFPRGFSQKYSHLGYTYIGVSEYWVQIVEKYLILIEKEMWVSWMPMFMKRLIQYLCYTNKYYIRSRFFLKVRSIFSNGYITDIKQKYGTLRIYHTCNDKVENLVGMAEQECSLICENCGSTKDVSIWGKSRIYNLCSECQSKRN